MTFALSEWFDAIDANGDGHLNALELQQALAQGDLHFDLRTVAHMVRAFDNDASGTVTLKEFQQLYKYINDTKANFKRYDRDNSLSLDFYEVY